MNPIPHITLLPGDGIGPEVTRAAHRVLIEAGLNATFDEHPIGWREWCEHGDPLPRATLDAARAADAILMGAITSKPEADAARELAPHLRNQGLRYRSPIVRLRKELDLYAGLRPARAWCGIPCAHPDTDILTVRESTEGLYCGIEIDNLEPDHAALIHHGLATMREHARGRIALSARVTTEHASRRILRIAFQQARLRAHQTGTPARVTLLEKPNILRATGTVMLDAARAVAADFPDVTLEIDNIDAACMHAVMDPTRYTVVVAENLFGDIFSDLAAGLTGGPGLAPSAAIGDRHALFEPVHGSAPDIAGRNIANPIAAILSGAMLARHINQPDVADRIERAVGATLANADPSTLTPDLRGRGSTTILTDAILRNLWSNDDKRVGE
ncbi:MAG: isocitrate/isopropylmalate dehydrogenase family protein [Phycisphaeraceae bacterium]|nr:MAG: isocitrate/isopropylmalate dehydrogenase family protein [Phycisphaeraceae bacterium]